MVDLRRSSTVLVLGVVGVVFGAVGLLALGWLVGALALALVVVVAVVGFWWERDRDLVGLLQFMPASVSKLDATACGVDKTAPWLLEKSKARDGEHLLGFVSRAEARAVGRTLANAVRTDASVVVGLIGEAKAGKTRCMFETVRRQCLTACCLYPRRAIRGSCVSWLATGVFGRLGRGRCCGWTTWRTSLTR